MRDGGLRAAPLPIRRSRHRPHGGKRRGQANRLMECPPRWCGVFVPSEILAAGLSNRLPVASTVWLPNEVPAVGLAVVHAPRNTISARVPERRVLHRPRALGELRGPLQHPPELLGTGTHPQLGRAALASVDRDGRVRPLVRVDADHHRHRVLLLVSVSRTVAGMSDCSSVSPRSRLLRARQLEAGLHPTWARTSRIVRVDSLLSQRSGSGFA